MTRGLAFLGGTMPDLKDAAGLMADVVSDEFQIRKP